jgi:hypothetical protein
VKENVMQTYVVDELGNCLIFQGQVWDEVLVATMERPCEWEDPMVKARTPIGGNNNRTWVGWKKL